MTHPDDKAVPPALVTALAEVDNLRHEVDRQKKKRKKLEAKAKASKGLGTSRGIETMFRTSYQTHNDLSNLADNKANIMISINSLIVSILLASISPKIDANPWLLLPTSVLLVGCVTSMVFAVLAARPRVSSRPVSLERLREEDANILFFGNFVNMREEEFIEGMKELMTNTDQLYMNMVRDIYSLGSVLAKKFRLLRQSYTVFIIGLIVGVSLYLVVFTSVVTRLPATVIP